MAAKLTYLCPDKIINSQVNICVINNLVASLSNRLLCVSMRSEQKTGLKCVLRPTLEMPASIMVLWFGWMCPGIAVTLWLLISRTESEPSQQILMNKSEVLYV